MNDVTLILSAFEQGDPRSAERLLPLVYGELRRLSAQELAKEGPRQTLQATVLVHEAYLGPVGAQDPGWDGRGHFSAAAAEAMRRILVDAARRKASLRHGGGRGPGVPGAGQVPADPGDGRPLAVSTSASRSSERTCSGVCRCPSAMVRPLQELAPYLTSEADSFDGGRSVRISTRRCSWRAGHRRLSLQDVDQSSEVRPGPERRQMVVGLELGDVVETLLDGRLEGLDGVFSRAVRRGIAPSPPGVGAGQIVEVGRVLAGERLGEGNGLRGRHRALFVPADPPQDLAAHRFQPDRQVA